MSDLRTILQQASIRRALLVDDAYDQVPLASDLSLDTDEWTHFFEDLTSEDNALLSSIHAGYKESRADELQVDDGFVAALWNRRDDLREQLVAPLFARYNTDTATDRAALDALLANLRDLGLECDTAGRGFKEKATSADLIVIDLYLGSTQDEAAIKTSIDGLVEVIGARPDRPPLVILISRSTRLEERREDFRDRSGLLESTFRIIRKAELAEVGKLQRILSRLAGHYADSLKLAVFLRAWQTGLKEACKRTSSLIRTLDLADHAQIRQLLLSAEGEPTGSYLVDVLDRVLQHESERERSIIDAAIALNTLTSETYPPPYVAGSRDLQNLVHRSLFQNRERLRLMGTEGCRVAFGDILRRKPALTDGVAGASGDTAAGVPNGPVPLSDVESLDVLAVLTPACDLQRQSAKRVLFLVGSLRPLRPSDWSYKEDPIRTPVIELADGQRFWIKWDVKHVQTLSHSELEKALEAPDGFEIVARLRESHALELQQKLLSNLGRVGLIAPMPATFPMRVEAHLPNADGKLVRLGIPALANSEGVCYVGRSGEKDMRLVLCEDACEAICEAIATIDLAGVHPDAHAAITYLRTSGELLVALEKGVILPSPTQQDFKDIASPTGSAPTGQGQNAKVRIIGLISRNNDVDKCVLSGREIRKAGIVLAVRDLRPEIDPKDGSTSVLGEGDE